MLNMLPTPKIYSSLLLSLISLTLPTLANANQVIESEGQVTAKYAGSDLFRPVTEGTSLHPGDILYPEANARVLVMCDSGSLWQVTPGLPASVATHCPSSPTTFVRSGFVDIIGQQDKKIPYLLSPRYTRLQDPHPTFRWNTVAGTQQYTVELLASNGLVHWSTTTDATTIKYPQDAPPLVEDINYLLIVETDSGGSSLDDAGGILGFFMLSSSEIQNIQREIDNALTQPDLTAAAQTLIKVNIYEKYGLFQDGIEILTQELQTNPSLEPNQKGLIYNLLGKLYTEVGLTRLAELYLIKSVELFKDQENDLGRAEALARLATVQWLNQQESQAQQTEQIALQIYQAKGDLGNKEQWEKTLKAARRHQPSSLPTQDYLDLGQGIRVPDQFR